VELTANDHANNLHGGPDGFDRRLWTTLEASGDHVVLELDSPDGDQGFPGRVRCRVRFEALPDRVRIEYSATTDAPTVVNLTNHAYFNLDGAGDVLGHRLSVAADAYTPVDDAGIPLGEHQEVVGTPLDLRHRALLADVVAAPHPQLVSAGGGLDHNFVLRGSGLREVAELESADGDVRLTLVSDQPGLQVFTANSFDVADPATSGGVHGRWAGVALEPQHFPDSPNRPGWPSTVLRPGETYRTVTEWRFTV
jgi:aldose 1-epimerase